MDTQLHRTSRVYEFGPFRLDADNQLLQRDNQPVPLTPKAFDALLLLVENSGRLVLKDDLVKAVWPDAFVSDANLTQTIFMVRRALGNSSDDPQYIVTVPGRGYRFAADVHQVATGQDTVPASMAEALPAPTTPRHGPIPHRLRPFWAAATVLLLVISSAIAARHWLRPHPRNAGRRAVLAVLPFANLTGDAGQDYFTDGVTDEMIAQLGRLDPQHLGVIARTSVMVYKGSPRQIADVGRDLGAEYVLEGSVRRDADRMRITAELIRVKDQTHLWAREYDREVKGLLALQTEIAQDIAGEIQPIVGGQVAGSLHAAASSPDYEAYDLYLRGQYFLNRRTDAGFEQAIEFFRQAIAKDPNYARSYAGLAHAYALLADYGTQPPEKYISNARVAALKALDIDPSLPQAHTALALILQSHDWDWQSAEKEFRRAIELNPNYATAHHWYAEHLMWRGRFNEALQESERARQLDPLSLIIAADNAAILYYSRQYDRAVEKLHSVLEIDPDFPRAFLIVPAYAEQGNVAEALTFVETHRMRMSKAYYWAFLAHIHGRNGHTEPARHALNELLQLNRSTEIDPVMLAWACAETGEKEQAIGWLQQAYAQHSDRLVGLKVNPVFDPLRGDPRFQSLMRRVGLAQ